MRTTTRMAPQLCPNCGSLLDAATSTKGGRHRPEPGSVTVCIYCAEILIFDAELNLSRCPAEELRQFQAEAPDLFKKLARARTLILLQGPGVRPPTGSS